MIIQDIITGPPLWPVIWKCAVVSGTNTLAADALSKKDSYSSDVLTKSSTCYPSQFGPCQSHQSYHKSIFPASIINFEDKMFN